MQPPFSRREFLSYAGSAAVALLARGGGAIPRPNADHSDATLPSSNGVPDRIVDIHVHFDEENPRFIDDLLKVSERLNLTACVLTPVNQ